MSRAGWAAVLAAPRCHLVTLEREGDTVKRKALMIATAAWVIAFGVAAEAASKVSEADRRANPRQICRHGDDRRGALGRRLRRQRNPHHLFDGTQDGRQMARARQRTLPRSRPGRQRLLRSVDGGKEGRAAARGITIAVGGRAAKTGRAPLIRSRRYRARWAQEGTNP